MRDPREIMLASLRTHTHKQMMQNICPVTTVCIVCVYVLADMNFVTKNVLPFYWPPLAYCRILLTVGYLHMEEGNGM